MIGHGRNKHGRPDHRHPGHGRPSDGRSSHGRRNHGRRVLMIVESLPLARDPRLRRQAEALLADGFSVTVICRADPANKTSVPGARVLEYPAPPAGTGPAAFAAEYLYSLTMAGLLASFELVRHGFDFVQVGSTPDIYFLLARPLRWLGRRVVFDFRDPSPETYAARYDSPGGLLYRALLWLEWNSFRAADRVLVVNDSLRHIARSRGGVDNDQIATVRAGPAFARGQRGREVPWLRAGRQHLCCWVGLMGPQDSVDLALAAVAELVHGRGRTDCSFAFVGTGDALPALRRQAADLGISDYVSFPGWARESLVLDYLATADLGLEPNTEDYISPVKVMEYMTEGLPVVAFETQETVRLAADAARYAPRRDTAAMAALIDELLDSAPARAQMGRAGQLRMRSFIAWEHQAVRYRAVYRELDSDRFRASGLRRSRRNGLTATHGWGA
jgi:glycosyltransferase involved in cell wall biosynthesis